MGSACKPHKVKLIVGMLSNDAAASLTARKALIRAFGPTDYESDEYDFTESDYYLKELGPDLKRRFYGFKKLLGLSSIYKVKLRTNAIEKRLSVGGKRKVNIDPGYLDLAKLVLFSTKDYTHRIYIKGGIYAEVTLHYKDGRYNAWPWTYPDYRSEAFIGIFNHIRNLYAKEGRRC